MSDDTTPQAKTRCEECQIPVGFRHREGCGYQHVEDLVSPEPERVADPATGAVLDRLGPKRGADQTTKTQEDDRG